MIDNTGRTMRHLGPLEAMLRAKRDAGRKLLIPYVTGGYPGWEAAIRAAAANGADVVEVGLPFSDPAMDGPVIQQASQRALDDGATPISIMDAISGLDAGIPIIVMCYYNTVFRAGHERFAQNLAKAGIAGAIVPDERLPRICARTRGFVYAVGLLGVTGERDSLAASATVMARRLKAITDIPVLIGVGVSNAAQAAEAVQVADGVIQGASVVRRLMDGGPDAVGDYVAEVRAAIGE